MTVESLINVPTVLIVDDDESLRAILEMVLQNYGIRTLTADNGVQACKVLTDNQVHAIISDVRMPQMDGVTFLKEIETGTKAPPVFIFITGYSADFTEAMALKMGANALIAKPFNAQMVVEVLQAAVSEAMKNPGFSEIKLKKPI